MRNKDNLLFGLVGILAAIIVLAAAFTIIQRILIFSK